jgi:hypothetical protein
MLSCGLRRPRMRRSLRRARLRNRPGQCGGFEVTRMRQGDFNRFNLMVSLSNHGPHRYSVGCQPLMTAAVWPKRTFFASSDIVGSVLISLARS